MSKLISSDNLSNALSSFNNKINSKINEKENKGHTHNYAGSSSVGGAANSVKTNLTIKLNNGTTEGTNLFTFNGSTAKTVNITPSAIGAAASSHGTHLTIGTGASNAAAGNHTHNYAGSSSAGGAATSANKVNTNLAIKLNGGTTEGTNLFTFNGSTAKTINITPSSIGAAASSHGTHVGDALSSTAAKANGTAAAGTSSKVAREDHVHPLQTTVSGNAGTATKLKTGRNITIGNKTNNFDGSGAISFSLSDIGALPLSGGTLTGRLHADGKLSVKARGGSWIDTVNFDNVAIANNTEPGSEGSYYPFLAARTDGMHTISLGSNYTNFGFYGFKNGRTENGVDLQFTFDVNAHTTYTNTWMKIDNGMEVAHDLNASLFRPKYAPGSQNCYIGGGSGDAADWDNHNMVIRSHWGIGFHDYENVCRIVFCTRSGNINTKGQLYSEGGVSTTQWIHANGSLSADGGATIGGHTYINAMSVGDKITGETKVSVDGAWADPWEGIGCAIKAHGHIATNYTVKAGYLNVPQGEFNGWPTGSDSFIKIRTEHDGNGQGDGVTHLGYNNGDGYHHFFRGTGAMHVNMHQGLQISNDFIYLAGVPLTISAYAPSRGGVWIQI